MSEYAIEIELKTQDNASKAIAALAQQAQAFAEKLSKMTGGPGPAQMQKDAEALAAKFGTLGGSAGSAGKQMTNAFGEATAASGGLMNSIKGLVGSLAGLAAIRSLIGAGIEFNRTMEDTRSGIAAMILSSHQFKTATGGVATEQQALAKSFEIAEGVQQRLLKVSQTTAASYTSLVSAFQSAYGPGIAAGITSVPKLEKVVVGVSQAVAALGLDSRQTTQEIRALFTGEQGPDNTLNRVLQITKGDLDRVRNSGGDVGNYLLTKLKPYMDAAAASTGNFSVVVSNLKDIWEQTAGEFAKPLFTAMIRSAQDAQTALAGTKDTAQAAGSVVGASFSQLAGLIQDVGGIAFGAFSDRAKEAGGTVAEVFQGLALVLAKWLAYARMGIEVIVTAIVHPLDAVRALFGSLMVVVLDGLSALASALPKGGPFKGITEQLNGAAQAVAEWAEKNNSFATGVQDAQNRASSAYSETEKRIVELGRSGKETSDITAEMVRRYGELSESLGKLGAAHPEAVKQVEALRQKLQEAAAAGPLNAAQIRAFETEVKQLGARLGPEYKQLLLSLRGDTQLEGLTGIAKSMQEEVNAFTKKSEEFRRDYGAHSEAMQELQKSHNTKMANLLSSGRSEWERVADDVVAILGKEADDGSAEIARLEKHVLDVVKRLEGLKAAPGLLTEADVSLVQKYEEALYNLVNVKKGFAGGKGNVEEMIDITPEIAKFQRQLDGLWTRVRLGAATMAEFVKVKGEGLVKFGRTAIDGIQGQMQIIAATLPSTAQSAADATAAIWQSMGNAFTDGFYNVLSGRIDNLKDVFKNLWDSVLKTFSQYLSNMLQKWIATQLEMESTSAVLGLSGGSGAVTGVGGASGGSNLPAWMGGYGGGGQAQQGSGGLGGGASFGGVLAGGAVGYGVGSAIGGASGAPGFAGGAAAGGALGGAIGSVVPVIGTIIGAVIGAIIGGLVGVLAASNTEAHLTGMVQMEIKKKGSAMAKSVETIYSGLVDVIVAGAPEQAAKISADYRDALSKALAATRYDIAAGSNEDIQKNWEWLINSLVPKMALQAAFGQVGMGLPSGNRDAAGGHGGFDWWSTGMDKDGNWIQQQLYDPNAPIPKMLTGLGFTGRKIEDLARELSNVDDPKAYLEKLKGLISIVVGINEIQKKLSMTRQEVFTELDKGFLDQFTKSRDQLITGFQNLGLYSGDEQIKKAQELIAATQQWYEQGLQYIGQLRGAMQNLLDSIDKQINSIKDAAKTWGQLMDDARTRANDAFKAIEKWGDATKPEQMQKDAQAAMEAIGQIVSGLQAVMQAARQAMQAVDAQVESMRTWNRSFSEQMAAAQATFKTASEGLTKPGLSPEEISKLSGDALNAVRTLFDGFVAIVRAAQQEISAIETQVSEMRNFGKTPDWLMADATRSASAGMARLGQSGLTPEEITRIGGEVREAVKTLYEGFKAIVQAAKAAKEQITGLVQSMRDWMKGPEWLLGDAKSNALWAGSELAKPGLSGDQITFWANKAIENVKRIFDALMAKINALRDAMAQIDTILAGLSTRIAQALGETPDQALARLGATARGSAGKITGTSSADDIKRYSSEAIAAVNQILDALLERLKRLTQLDKDLKDLGVKFGTAWADAIQEQMDASNPIAAYERATYGLQNKVKDAALLSGDAQVSAIEDVRDAALQMYEQQKQLLASIAKNAADLKKSIESQIWEIQYGEMTPQGQAGAVQERIQALRQQLANASSPEVARQISDEIQSLVTRYLGLFGKDDPNRADAVKWSTDLLKDVEKLGLDTYARMQKQIEDANKLVQEALKEAGGLVTGAMKSTATEIDAWRGFLEQMRGNLKAVEGTLGTEIETWANFLEGLQGPLNTAINWASGQITAWANALDGLRTPLETAVNWASFQIQAWANSLAGINFPLQAHVNAAAAEIGQWTAALTALRTKIEIDFTTLIDNVLAELKPLGEELAKAKTLFTDLNEPVLLGVTSSAKGAGTAMDGAKEAADGLRDALNALTLTVNQPGGPDSRTNPGGAQTQSTSANAVLRAIRRSPRLTFSQVGA